MGTNKNSISYASFITKFYFWSISYLTRKGILKHFIFFLVVLFCTLTRFVVLSFDKTVVKEAKVKPFIFKLVKLPVKPNLTLFKTEMAEIRLSPKTKITDKRQER